MLMEIYVDVPQRPDVGKYILAERPGMIFINRSGDACGETRILTQEQRAKKDKKETTA